MKFSQSSRRRVLGACAALAFGASLFGSGLALAQAAKLKVAAIYTVPVEQQWVSRIDKALKAAQARGDITYKFSENVANTDYERVMRQYAEEGNDLIVGEAFAVERAARKVAADYPKTAFLMGSSFGPTKRQFRGVRQLDPRAILPDRHGRRQAHQVQRHRHGRGLCHPRSEPADARLHRGGEVGQPERQVPHHLHQLLVRPAQGEGSGLRHDRQGRGRALRRALRRHRRGQGAGRQGDRQCHRHLGASIRAWSSPRRCGTWSRRSTGPSRR